MTLFDLMVKISVDTDDFDDAVKDARKSADKLGDELGDDLPKATKDASKGLKDTAEATEKMSNGFTVAKGVLSDLISTGIQSAISAVGNLASSIWNLDESTEEYRKAQGRLNTAFETAGFSAETAQEAYNAFYGILGDTDTATEASQLLAQLADSAEDVSVWTNIAAGVSGTFGDSLPIEGLIEAANETANVGTVTGVLADALNWVGISEDEFNEKLAECSSESERNQLIMETLAAQYDEASDAFYRNNAALVESRNNQALLDESLSKIGQSISTVKNSLLNAFAPAISYASTVISDFLDNIDVEQVINTAITFFMNLKNTFIDVFTYLSTVFSPAFTALKNLFDTIVLALQPIITGLQNYVLSGTAASDASNLLNTALTALSSIITTVANALSSFVTWLTSGSAGAETFKAVVTAVGAALLTWKVISTISSLMSTLSTIVNTAKTAFAAFNVVLNANPIGIVITAISGLVAAFTYLWNNCEAFREFWINLWDNIKEVFGRVADYLSEKIENIKQWFSNAWENIKNTFASWGDFFRGLWDDLTGIFSNAFDWFKNIGSNIVNGVKNGISNAWNGLVNWFNGLWDNLVGGVKRFLGISSPSKLFEDEIGVNMALGVGEGWEKEFGDVRGQIEDGLKFDSAAIDTESSAMGRALGAGEAGAFGGGAYAGTTININIDGARYSDENALAEAIAERMEIMTNRRGAVFA